ncbi:hypothetical protein BCU71_14885 [Vibrio lentus]|nr:hypothetical protein BCU71_14885 [Vibrio lentus]PMK68884.1 hypothetical protein BCT93_17980 [Vibrio lentus]
MHQICTQAHLIYKNQGFRESDTRLWGLINIGMKKLEIGNWKRKRRENIKSRPRAENPNEELSVTEHKTLGIKRQT